MSETQTTSEGSIAASIARAAPPARSEPRTRGLLSGMRVRKKLIFLHTTFSLSLAMILVVGIREKVRGIVRRAELDLARQLLDVELSGPGSTTPSPLQHVRRGDAGTLGLSEHMAISMRQDASGSLDIDPGLTRRVREVAHDASGTTAGLWLGEDEGYAIVTARSDAARAGVDRLYIALVLALLAVYGLVALALEVLVLPTHVYAPIRRILRADRAVQEGNPDEIIPAREIPADELGEIMRSRNETIRTLRAHERDLAHALDRLETVAHDLTRKNHLLERARENLADADRLRSLAIMSAGLAHEMNTPLTVLKGLAERLARFPDKGLEEDKAALMLRVVQRLEGLSESLLDFARVRPPKCSSVELAGLLDEVVTLVRLDRGAAGIHIDLRIPHGLIIECDRDRMVQVMVNLVRNAVDAIAESADAEFIEIDAHELDREGERWVSITVGDDGPGIHPSVLPTLFDPFVSTRLDARGTGLGLAVAEGIIKEHGGVMLARNHPDRRGAVFEVLMPVRGVGERCPKENPMGKDQERV